MLPYDARDLTSPAYHIDIIITGSTSIETNYLVRSRMEDIPGHAPTPFRRTIVDHVQEWYDKQKQDCTPLIYRPEMLKRVEEMKSDIERIRQGAKQHGGRVPSKAEARAMTALESRAKNATCECLHLAILDMTGYSDH
jgi:hypothetical protein